MTNRKETLTGKEMAFGYAMATAFIFLVCYGISSIGSYGKDEESTSYASASSTKPDAVDAAFGLCEIMSITGLVSQCEVQGWGSTVDVRIDTTGVEAIKMCSDTSDVVARSTSGFSGKGWTLQIFSPYSGDRPLARCSLR